MSQTPNHEKSVHTLGYASKQNDVSGRIFLGQDAYGRTFLGQLDRAYLRHPAVRWGLLALLGVVLFVPAAQFVYRIRKMDSSMYREGGTRHKTALGRWLPDAEALTKLDQGENPYGEGHWFPQPPFVLMTLVPLWKIGYVGAGIIWATLKIGGFLGVMWLLLRSVGWGLGVEGWGGRGAGRTHGGVILSEAKNLKHPLPESVPPGTVEMLRFAQHDTNPQPPTLDPRPSTLDPQPSALNPQPSTLSPQPSTLSPQPSALNYFPVPLGVLILVAVFSIRPIVSDLQHGNVNIFMMIWVGLCWALYMRGRDGAAGMMLGLAIVTKTTPALLLVYFLYKRAWRVAAGTGLSLFLLFILIPGLVLGFDKNLELLRAWYAMLVEPYVKDGYVASEIANQALYGVVMRILSGVGLMSLQHMPLHEALEAGMEDMARPESSAWQLLRPAISVTIFAGLGWLCRTPTKRGALPASGLPADGVESRAAGRRDVRLWLEFSLVLLAMLLMSERTWKHHATTLPIVFLSVWYAFACLPWPRRFRGRFAVGLAVQFGLLVGTSEGILGDRLADWLLWGGVFCWGLVLCMVQTGMLLRRLREPSLVEWVE